MIHQLIHGWEFSSQSLVSFSGRVTFCNFTVPLTSRCTGRCAIAATGITWLHWKMIRLGPFWGKRFATFSGGKIGLLDLLVSFREAKCQQKVMEQCDSNTFLIYKRAREGSVFAGESLCMVCQRSDMVIYQVIQFVTFLSPSWRSLKLSKMSLI